jgi:AraC family transcriptional regulator of adaptative response / DNA-3-methyladenine glycosylase II
LSYRPPFDWLAFLDFLGARATPGVESVKNGVYRRTIRSGPDTGTIAVWQSGEPNTLTLEIEGRFSRELLPIVERVRDLFDLRADPHKIESHLKQSQVLRTLLEGRSVPRVPGAWDGFELAVRAILGQQVSVRGATTVAGRLAARYGEPVTGDTEGLTVLFPTPESLAVAEIENCGFPGARGRAITLLARAVCDGKLRLGPSADPETVRRELCSIPGIGQWTADYIAMRALCQPDAFPVGDLGLRKAMSRGDKPISSGHLEKLSEEWRPWRAYAAMLLWNSL